MLNKNTKPKSLLHKNNRHRDGYQFDALCKAYPTLSTFIQENNYTQQPTIDFSNSDAVKALNTALLKQYYHISHWDIPAGYLCPAIPGRVDYIHYLADLLKQSKNRTDFPKHVHVLDIGTGASCIYPILGQKEYNWNFTASDIDPISIKVANTNISANKGLSLKVKCRIQPNANHFFTDIIKKNEFYHLTMCNPPFYKSIHDANKSNLKKQNNLNKNKDVKVRSVKLNFGGQKAELWCKGGELSFINSMIEESTLYQKQVLWFTCLVSKKEHISRIKQALKKANACQVKVIKMAQGQKTSRFIAWSYFDLNS